MGLCDVFMKSQSTQLNQATVRVYRLDQLSFSHILGGSQVIDGFVSDRTINGDISYCFISIGLLPVDLLPQFTNNLSEDYHVVPRSVMNWTSSQHCKMS